MVVSRKLLSPGILAGATLAILAMHAPALAQTTAATLPAALPDTLPAAAAPAHPIDTGSTAWLMVSAALVLFMIPGLAMFYGGMVRAKNVLNAYLCCLAPIGVIGFLWVAVGYAIAFPVVAPPEGKTKAEPSYFAFDSGMMFIDHLGAKDIKAEPAKKENYKIQTFTGDTEGSVENGVPEIVFFCFQGMFAIITPALIYGAIAERVRFGPYLLFITLWSLLVYCPVAHWVWNPAGWLFQMGVMDFAGGTVVHVLAGVSGLAVCLVAGKRRGYDGRTPIPPHSVGLTLLGAAFLMVGWFGFNAGSAIALPKGEQPVAGAVAGLAFGTTFIAAAMAAFTWMIMEWIVTKKPTALGVASGLVAGLVVITPCAGHVTVKAAALIGLMGGLVCFGGCRIKYILGFDDSLDAFGVHGIGGYLGALLVGIFAIRPLTTEGTFPGGMGQLWLQFQGATLAAIYAFVVSLILALIIKSTIGLRVKPEVEDEGLDVNIHGEEGYKFT